MIAMSQNAFSMENLHEAYIKARKGKRGSVNTRGFEVNLYAELQYLSFSLRNGSYSPSRSVCFYVQKPKLREIFAANFRDRVVHRLLVDILEPEFEKTFIYDSWANRSGKGTHSAVGRLKEFVKRGTSDGSLPFYYLQLDIKGYFMSLDKKILMRLLERKVQSKELLHLSRTIVMHDPTQNFVFKGKIPPAGILPPHKTLFHDNPGKGIPIVRRRVVKNFFAAMHESLPPQTPGKRCFFANAVSPGMEKLADCPVQNQFLSGTYQICKLKASGKKGSTDFATFFRNGYNGGWICPVVPSAPLSVFSHAGGLLQGEISGGSFDYAVGELYPFSGKGCGASL